MDIFTYLAGYSDITRTERGLWKSLFTGICEAPQEDDSGTDEKPARMETCHGLRLSLKQREQNLPKWHCPQAALGDVGQNHEELLESPELTVGRVWAALCQEHRLALLHLLEQCILAALGGLPAPADFCPVLQLEGEAFPPASC